LLSARGSAGFADENGSMKLSLSGLLLVATIAHAHVGSPDIFFEGHAGAYPVSVAIRPPSVIPGLAQVEVRVAAEGLTSVHVVPFPLTGRASKYPPTPDLAKRADSDPQLFTASVWLMAFGSFQVQVDIEGTQGHGTVSVPIPSVSREVKSMNAGLGWVLVLLLSLLVAGAVSIAGAAARESTLPEGESSNPVLRRRSRFVMAGTALAILSLLALGSQWWGAEASNYRDHIYKPSSMTAKISKGILYLELGGQRLASRPPLNDYLPDHGHLMHLFMVSMPQMDHMWHLHPDLVGNGQFIQTLPTLPAGRYKLFADVVRASGFPETPAVELEVPFAIKGHALSGDDAEGAALPLAAFDAHRSVALLNNGYRMVRTNNTGTVLPKQMLHLTFEVQDSTGKPATDLEPYMGMAAHAEFLLDDASVFAHVHPSGTVPMAALGLTAQGSGMPAGHTMQHMAIPAQFAFPYGFPKAGRYRMFIQIQRSGVPETASFDFDVRDRIL
jgi:hypothetical protein